jgi:hypothetical protein
LPNPTEKRSTFTPQRRATQKWPNSWKVTSTPSATMKASTVVPKVVSVVIVQLRRMQGRTSPATAPRRRRQGRHRAL